MRATVARLTSLLLLSALLGCSSTPEPEMPESPSAELPIRRVVLYQNGVGYFERRGSVEGGAFALQARPSQINDLLKSLTVIDFSEGRAVSVSLPLQKGGDRVLSELPEQVRQAGGVLQVLTVFRGARVEVFSDSGPSPVTGRIVGVEDLRQQDEETEEVVPDWRLTLKTESGDLVVLPVGSISRIAIRDRTLAVGLEQSLDVSLKEGDWKPVLLSIRLAGERKHDLMASYIVEMPRWKPAYRMVLSDEKKPLLQGWAVVDNVSGEDWTNVELSLVAGTPMSFVYDLHSPQYTTRVDLTPRTAQSAVAPPPDEAGVSDKERLQEGYASNRKKSSSSGAASDLRSSRDEELEDISEESYAPAPAMAPMRSMMPPAPKPPSMDDALQADASEAPTTQKIGALFRYDVRDPVTIPDRSSTLVAIINERVDGQEVVYFRPELHQGGGAFHPYRAVRLDNNTTFTLETGPITVYSNGTFVGEGFLERMDAGTTSMLTFAIDSNVSLETSQGYRDESMRLIRIVDGMLVSENLRVESVTYAVDNRHDKAMTAFVKTPKRTDWKLNKRPKETVETSDSLLVPVRVGARAKAELKLEWTRRVSQQVSVDSSNTETLLKVFLASGKAPPTVAKVLEEILQLKRQLNDNGAERERVEEQRRHLDAEQARVRKNLKLLNDAKGNAALKATLTRKLASLEEELGKLSGDLVRLSEADAELRSRMTVQIRSITLSSTQ